MDRGTGPIHVVSRMWPVGGKARRANTHQAPGYTQNTNDHLICMRPPSLTPKAVHQGSWRWQLWPWTPTAQKVSKTMHTPGSKQSGTLTAPHPRCVNLAHPCPCFLDGRATLIINCETDAVSSLCSWVCDLGTADPEGHWELHSWRTHPFFHLCEQCLPLCPNKSAPREGNASLKPTPPRSPAPTSPPSDAHHFSKTYRSPFLLLGAQRRQQPIPRVPTSNPQISSIIRSSSSHHQLPKSPQRFSHSQTTHCQQPGSGNARQF